VLRSGNGAVDAKLCLERSVWPRLPKKRVTQWWGRPTHISPLRQAISPEFWSLSRSFFHLGLTFRIDVLWAPQGSSSKIVYFSSPPLPLVQGGIRLFPQILPLIQYLRQFAEPLSFFIRACSSKVSERAFEVGAESDMMGLIKPQD